MMNRSVKNLLKCSKYDSFVQSSLYKHKISFLLISFNKAEVFKKCIEHRVYKFMIQIVNYFSYI